jgi:hypothetical protein
MPTPNPDTHCTSCGEVLSIYRHCWRCHWPPMDSAQDAVTKTTTVAAKPHHIPCGQCGACYANESCGLLQPQPIDHAKLKVHAPAIVHARPQDLV